MRPRLTTTVVTKASHREERPGSVQSGRHVYRVGPETRGSGPTRDGPHPDSERAGDFDAIRDENAALPAPSPPTGFYPTPTSFTGPSATHRTPAFRGLGWGLRPLPRPGQKRCDITSKVSGPGLERRNHEVPSRPNTAWTLGRQQKKGRTRRPGGRVEDLLG